MTDILNPFLHSFAPNNRQTDQSLSFITLVNWCFSLTSLEKKTSINYYVKVLESSHVRNTRAVPAIYFWKGKVCQNNIIWNAQSYVHQKQVMTVKRVSQVHKSTAIFLQSKTREAHCRRRAVVVVSLLQKALHPSSGKWYWMPWPRGTARPQCWCAPLFFWEVHRCEDVLWIMEDSVQSPLAPTPAIFIQCFKFARVICFEFSRVSNLAEMFLAFWRQKIFLEFLKCAYLWGKRRLLITSGSILSGVRSSDPSARKSPLMPHFPAQTPLVEVINPWFTRRGIRLRIPPQWLLSFWCGKCWSWIQTLCQWRELGLFTQDASSRTHCCEWECSKDSLQLV